MITTEASDLSNSLSCRKRDPSAGGLEQLCHFQDSRPGATNGKSFCRPATSSSVEGRGFTPSWVQGWIAKLQGFLDFLLDDQANLLWSVAVHRVIKGLEMILGDPASARKESFRAVENICVCGSPSHEEQLTQDLWSSCMKCAV